ncbi:MAG: hypothetical protein KDC39_08835 [Actinobacteria bacterium]|nr:hypothetical protein [Actinomycetota bacterium]
MAAPARLGLTLVTARDSRSLDAILLDADYAIYDAKRADGDVPALVEQGRTVNE